MTAAIYTARRSMKTLVISQDIGGQASMASVVENYPGFEPIKGAELMDKFRAQAQKFGAEIIIDEIRKIQPDQDGGFTVLTSNQEYKTETVILAFGLSHRHLEVPGEEKFVGRGVVYCATCDGPLYKGKRVAIVGGGNSALDAGVYMSDIAFRVYMIHRRSEFRGEEILADHLAKKPNVEFFLNSKIREIKGEQRVKSIIIEDINEAGKIREVEVDGVFVEIGYVVKADFIKGLVEVDAQNQIKISPDCETSVPGIFAAGDATTVSYKQIVISAGEGCKAALRAHLYLQKKRGRQGIIIDWQTVKNH